MKTIFCQGHFSAPRILATRVLCSIVVIVIAVLLNACGGGASTESNPATTNTVSTSSYTGPNALNDDVRAFQINVWERLRSSTRCGACHFANFQSPEFARSDDVNLAYSAAISLVDLDNPPNSRLVTKVAGGHNCWLPSDAACATAITAYIEKWAEGISTGGRKIQLIAPIATAPGSSKRFPADAGDFGTFVWPVLTANCAGCHVDTATTPQSPFFASPDIDEAYAAAQPKINLNDPSSSRLVLRLRDEFHNCWSDCASNATTMENAIKALAAPIIADPVQAPVVFSNALTIQGGVAAAGGNRYETDVIALYEFRTGTGNTILDLSGVDPELNLTMSGNVDWVGGYGIQIIDGKAQGSTSASKKLTDLIKLTGEYSIEAWVVPANVVQEGPASIVSYSAGATIRNFTLGQTKYSYDFLHRSSTTDGNGEPALSTVDEDESLQASLQHVVVTFDPINGRRIYVNGALTDSIDTVAAGNINDWDDSFALVLGNEVSSDRLWQGTLRMVAIHNRVLTLPQIQQNFDAGVGAKFFLLFGISGVGGVPADSYIMFEVEQFDTYSYMFNKPTFINLNPDVTPNNLLIKGIRIGINSKEADVGQAYVNLSVNVDSSRYNAETGQLLSSLGTIISLENGSNGSNADEFFLTFETLGSSSNVTPIPGVLSPIPLPNPGTASEIGLRTFDEINATMTALTGVNSSIIQNSFLVMRQSLPSVENIEAFLSAHQMSITQLSIEYCDALVENTAVRNAFFNTAGFDFNANVATAFSAGKAAAIVDELYNKMIGLPGSGADLSDAPSRAEVQEVLVDGYNDVDLNGNPYTVTSLFDTMSGNCGACNANASRTIVKGLCGALLGSATMLVQ